MWLSFYNKKGIGDTLLLTSGTANRYDVDFEKKGNVTQVFVRESKEVLGYNIEKISEVISFEEDGQQVLTPKQQEVVKGLIEKAGFDVSTLDLTPEDALVVGYVESCVDHEDSDHLHVTMTRVSDSEVLQIVCGAPNVKAGQKVVVAKPGTVTTHKKFTAQVYVLTKDEGGRHTPFFNNYRPQFYFRTTDVTGVCELPAGTEMCMPGDNVEMTVELIHNVAMEQGLRFAIREGGRTVGSGAVATIIE